MSSEETKPEIPKIPPALALNALRAEYYKAAGVLTGELAKIESKVSPTTYQTYRWLCGGFTEAGQKLEKLAKEAELDLSEDLVVPDMLPFQISVMLENAENRVIEAMKEFGLEDLPSGNPGEPEFERLLKKKIALNRSYSECLRHLATIANALGSETYKIGINEEQRDAAWRDGRKKKLEEILTGTQKQIRETEEYLAKLRQVEVDVVVKLKDNEQLNFFSEIDPEAKPEIGEPETPDNG